MNYSFHPEAHAEFEQATLYYSEKSSSLASAFYVEQTAILSRLKRFKLS